MNYRRALEQIEIVAYISKHKDINEKDINEVLVERQFLNNGAKEYRKAFVSQPSVPPNKNYQWCLEEIQRLDDIIYNLKGVS